jgi:hypothetical protein
MQFSLIKGIIEMKFCLRFIFTFLLFTSVNFAQKEIKFDDYFTNHTLRIDYLHVGNAAEEMYIMDKMYKVNVWPGTVTYLSKAPNLGKYFYKVFDKDGEKLLFAKGFDTYFGEYQTTKPAKEGIKKSYQESALIPFPKEPILFVIEKRDRDQRLRPQFTKVIDPGDYNIISESQGLKAEIIEATPTGDPARMVDIVILGEGYTIGQREKFVDDLNRFSKTFFEWQPYKDLSDKFCIRGIFVASQDSGVDEPRKKIYKNSVFKCTFNSLDSERYLLTEDNNTMHDYAGLVPYDAIFIMVNSKRYGGGGIYNSFCAFTSDGRWNDFVFHHEFGHSFAGLADEYFSDDVSYEEFYPRGIEPLEPNITALLDPTDIKWKDQLFPGIDIPTPWDKEEYEELTGRFEKLREEHEKNMEKLRADGAGENDLQREASMYRLKQNDVREALSDFFENHPLKGMVGAFQGAGYDPAGFYRPTINSVMHRFSKSEATFYPVSEQHIRTVVSYYTDDQIPN